MLQHSVYKALKWQGPIPNATLEKWTLIQGQKKLAIIPTYKKPPPKTQLGTMCSVRRPIVYSQVLAAEIWPRQEKT